MIGEIMLSEVELTRHGPSPKKHTDQKPKRSGDQEDSKSGGKGSSSSTPSKPDGRRYQVLQPPSQ